jgi:hypothetical protein
MEFIESLPFSTATGVILHWLKGVRVSSKITLGAEIKRTHGSFRVGDVIFIEPNKFKGHFPLGLNLAECDPVLIVEVINKGRMSTTLKSIGIDNKTWCLTNTFRSQFNLPHRLIEKSGEKWYAEFSDATFVSFETNVTDRRPQKIGALLHFDDGTKRRSRNRISPELLNHFASSWNKELVVRP